MARNPLTLGPPEEHTNRFSHEVGLAKRLHVQAHAQKTAAEPSSWAKPYVLPRPHLSLVASMSQLPNMVIELSMYEHGMMLFALNDLV